MLYAGNIFCSDQNIWVEPQMLQKQVFSQDHRKWFPLCTLYIKSLICYFLLTVSCRNSSHWENGSNNCGVIHICTSESNHQIRMLDIQFCNHQSMQQKLILMVQLVTYTSHWQQNKKQTPVYIDQRAITVPVDQGGFSELIDVNPCSISSLHL